LIDRLNQIDAARCGGVEAARLVSVVFAEEAVYPAIYLIGSQERWVVGVKAGLYLGA
jgi:hypothetical protein